MTALLHRSIVCPCGCSPLPYCLCGNNLPCADGRLEQIRLLLAGWHTFAAHHPHTVSAGVADGLARAIEQVLTDD